MSASPKSCSRPRSPRARATAARAASRPRASPRARRSRSSTSPSSARSSARSSSTSASSTSCTRARTSSCSARPAPARPTSRSRSRSAPASPATASQFATATEWVARLAEAKRHNSLDAELRRLSFIPLLVVDEVGYIPFDPEAANLMFSLVSARYERASLIVTCNKPFSRLGRDLRRRGHRRRDDRPARPPRRDPLAQGRLLPPARQGPRAAPRD